MGTPGLPSPAVIGANLVFVNVLINGVPGDMLVDTGAPYTFINPPSFPGAGVPAMGGAAMNVTFVDVPSNFTVDKVPAYGDSADPLPDGGIVGGNLLRQFAVVFDYRDQEFFIGGDPQPTGVDAGTSTPFTLQGGGLARLSMGDPMAYVVPATRIPVTVDVEGTAHPFILDSGASEVAVRQSLYDQLVADGRPQISGAMVSTVYGMMPASISRLRTITAGGQQLSNPAVLSVADSFIDGLVDEVGHPVDGLLGASFLRQFLVTVDYPHGALRLQHYTTPPLAAVDEFQRVGIGVALTSAAAGRNAYAVSFVFPGSDAEAHQVMAGDQLLSIDGVALSGLDSGAVTNLLEGPVGSTHAIGFGATGALANQNATLNIRVDDLLPDPS